MQVRLPAYAKAITILKYLLTEAKIQVFSLFIFRIIISRKHVQIHESVSASALTVPPLPSAPVPCWKKSHRPAQFTEAGWSNLRLK